MVELRKESSLRPVKLLMEFVRPGRSVRAVSVQGERGQRGSAMKGGAMKNGILLTKNHDTHW